MIVLKKKLLERERERHMSTKQVSLVTRRFESCQRQTIAHTIIFILVLDLVVEVLDALGHLFFVDRVIDVEIVEIGVAHVGFPVLVQLGRARYRSAISSLEKKTSNLVFFFQNNYFIPSTHPKFNEIPSEQSSSSELGPNLARSKLVRLLLVPEEHPRSLRMRVLFKPPTAAVAPAIPFAPPVG